MGAAVTFDDRGVTLRHPDGRAEFVGWPDLRAVAVETTDAGPFAEDVFFVLRGGAGVCRVPQGAAGGGELLARLQELPGFDNEPVIRAMSSAGHASFACWARGGG